MLVAVPRPAGAGPFGKTARARSSEGRSTQLERVRGSRLRLRPRRGTRRGRSTEERQSRRRSGLFRRSLERGPTEAPAGRSSGAGERQRYAVEMAGGRGRLGRAVRRLRRAIRDPRVERSGREVAADLGLLSGLIGRDPAIDRSDLAPAQTRRALETLAGIARERDLYLRPGADGVVDLLSDRTLRGELIDRLSRPGAGRDGARMSPRQVRDLETSLDALARSAGAVSFEPIAPPTERGALARPRARGPPSRPLEIEVLLAREPGAASILSGLAERGVPVRLQRLRETPTDVLDAIQLISVVTQENGTLHWLPQLVRDGKRPVLTPTPDGLRRATELGMIEDGHIDQAELERAVDRIAASTSESLRVVVGHNPAGITDASPEVVALNRALEPTRRLWATRRVMFDTSAAQTEGAREVIKKMMIIGPAAHGLEMLNLGVVASLLTGSADDVLGEVAQLKALRGAGFSRRELWRRAGVLAPVAIGAMGLAGYSSVLIEHGHPLLGGAAFGASAVALSITSAVQSVRMYRRAYDTLLRGGKIPGKLGPMMKREVQTRLRRLDRRLGRLTEPEHRAELLKLVGQTLDAEVAGGMMERTQADQILADLGRLDLSQLKGRAGAPGSLGKWKHAVQQAFANPATRGMAVGAAMAPFLGMAAARGHLLENGFILTLVGSSESLIAGATVFGAGVLDQRGYQRELQRELKAARAR